MQPFTDWSFSYCVGILVGAVMGIFYALDGWNGSEKIVAFKDSNRAKNLVWVLGGAFLGLVSDIKPIGTSSGHDPDKVTLLFWYLLAFVVFALGMILTLAAGLLADNLVEGIGRRFGYTAFAALGDYLHYGWAAYSLHKRDAIRQARENFHILYAEQLAQTIAAVGQRSERDRLKIVQQILLSIAAVVAKYRLDGSAVIRANLMVVRETAKIPKEKLELRFNAGDPEQFLDLIAYSDGDQGRLRLPLSTKSDAETHLPGAPKACLSGIPEIIDDCKKIEFGKSIAKDIQKDMRSYFASKERSFRSFASLPVLTDGPEYSIVNIDCSDRLVFGTDGADRDTIIRNLQPFLCAIGIISSELKKEVMH